MIFDILLYIRLLDFHPIMRYIILTLSFVILTGGVFSQTPGSIYAVVYGDMVTLHEDNAGRNCGFSPSLENIVVSENVINWYQTDTVSELYRCLCTFNYQVEIDSLKSGNYTVRVYSVYFSDTTFMGSTSFSFESSFTQEFNLKLKSYASDCLSNIEEGFDYDLTFFYDYEAIVFIHEFLTIRKISLVNMSGITVQNKIGNDTYLYMPVKSLKRGIYIAIIQTDQGQSIRKVIITE